MLAHWRFRLLELEFDVVHRPGRQQQAPDAVSRSPNTGSDTTPLRDDVPVFIVTRDDDIETEEAPINAANLRLLCD